MAEGTSPPPSQEAILDPFDVVQHGADLLQERSTQMDIDYVSGALKVESLPSLNLTLWRLCSNRTAIRRPDEELKGALQVIPPLCALVYEEFAGVRVTHDAVRPTAIFVQRHV